MLDLLEGSKTYTIGSYGSPNVILAMGHSGQYPNIYPTFYPVVAQSKLRRKEN